MCMQEIPVQVRLQYKSGLGGFFLLSALPDLPHLVCERKENVLMPGKRTLTKWERLVSSRSWYFFDIEFLLWNLFCSGSAAFSERKFYRGIGAAEAPTSVPSNLSRWAGKCDTVRILPSPATDFLFPALAGTWKCKTRNLKSRYIRSFRLRIC